MEIRRDEICNVVDEAIMPDENEIFEAVFVIDICHPCSGYMLQRLPIFVSFGFAHKHQITRMFFS